MVKMKGVRESDPLLCLPSVAERDGQNQLGCRRRDGVVAVAPSVAGPNNRLNGRV